MTSPSDTQGEPLRLLDLDSDLSADGLGLLEAGRDCGPSDDDVESLSAKLAPLVAPAAAAAAATVVTGIALTEAAKGGTTIAAWFKAVLLSKWLVTSTVVAGTAATAVAVTQIELAETEAPAAIHVAGSAKTQGAVNRAAATEVEAPPLAVAEPEPALEPALEPELNDVAAAPVAAAPPQRAVPSAPSASAMLPLRDKLEAPARSAVQAPPTAAFPTVAAPLPEPPNEGELLSRAFAALQGGDPAGALRLTREHQSLTGTALSQERERIAIEALVQLGQRSAAKTRAEAFARRFPKSTYLPRIEALFQVHPEKTRSQ